MQIIPDADSEMVSNFCTFVNVFYIDRKVKICFRSNLFKLFFFFYDCLLW